MHYEQQFFGREDLKLPAVLGFLAIYIFAIVLVLLNKPQSALLYIGLSIGIVFLCWLVVELTTKMKIQSINIKQPGFELIVGIIILAIWHYFPNMIKIDFGDKWSLGFILKKTIILVCTPFLFLKMRKHSLASMGITIESWKKNLWMGFIVFLAMAIPSALFVANTGSEILSGKYSALQVGIGLLSSFIYYFLMSGFSEEFLIRAFIQTRVSCLLKSSISGVLVTSLVFGLIHIPNIMQWYPGTKVVEAFIRALFLQTFMGILLGTLWERTKSLIPCAFVHSGINGLNNLSHIISKLGI